MRKLIKVSASRVVEYFMLRGNIARRKAAINAWFTPKRRLTIKNVRRIDPMDDKKGIRSTP